MNDAPIPTGNDATAAEHIEQYLARVDAALQRAGASITERGHVLENIRSQILEMLVSPDKDENPTPAEVKAVISELDLPEDFAAGYVQDSEVPAGSGDTLQSAVASQPTPPRNPSRYATTEPDQYFSSFGAVMFTLFAIALPTAALAIELTTRICTSELFNPIPTLAHILCVAFVPAVYLLGLIAVKRQKLTHPRTMVTCTGIATGISLIYTLQFLPMLPISVIAILFMGIGILPFAPVGALFGGLRLKKHLYRLIEKQSSPSLPPYLFGISLLFGIALIFASYYPAYLINYSIQEAANGTSAERKAALQRLRFLRATDDVLALAYSSRNRSGDLSIGNTTMGPWGIFFERDADAVPRNDARSVYYRLTDQPFNSVPPPVTIAPMFGVSQASFERNPEMRDGNVGWIDKDLTLKSSRIDSIADADTATGYVEWTMTFHNATKAQREARSQLLLPPGGVVSRLTLWVNGEEREAAFAGRDVVKAAYERVVQRQQDPVLVTTSGPDRVLVQCFPVPAGGDMKIRIGITHPLPLNGDSRMISFPRHLERNYDVPGETKHSVWLEVHGALKGKVGHLTPTTADTGNMRLAGQVTEDELAHSGNLLLAGASTATQIVPDLREPAKFVIEQTIKQVATTSPATLIMVLDTSLSVKPHLSKLLKACSQLPAATKVRLLLSGEDYTAKNSPDAKPKDLTPQALAAALKQVKFEGGQDNLPSLREGWLQAINIPDSAVLWVHGPQAVALTSPDNLVQLFERGNRTRPDIYEVLLAAGPDRIVGTLERYCNIKFIHGIGDDALTQVGSLFSDWKSGKSRQELVRSRRTLANGETPTSATRASGHLARLWALEESMRLFHKGGEPTNAVQLAAKYQLVTPFTGAVVLENKSQYDEAGLKPVNPGTVPTIPEPEEWALILVAIVLLVLGLWKAKRSTQKRMTA